MLQFHKLYWQRTNRISIKKEIKSIHTYRRCVKKRTFSLSIIVKRSSKANHLNSSKLHLNRRGAKILSNSFLQHISKVFKWQLAGNNSDCNFSIYDFEKHGSGQAEVDCQSVLKSLRKDTLNKLIFDHLNINSIRTKREAWVLLNPPTTDLPTHWPLTPYLPTHQPLTQRPTDPIITDLPITFYYLKDSGKRKIFILQNTNTGGNV